MNIISADLGSYSLKILVSKQDRGKIFHKSTLEIPLDYSQKDKTDVHGLWALQIRELTNFLEEISGEYRLLINAPMDILTFRLTTLPVNQLKKAQLMLPFKLEESVPFAMTDTHFDAIYKVDKAETSAFVAMSLNQHYEDFYHQILKYGLNPRIISCESSNFGQWAKLNHETLPNNFAIIDIGHNTTHGHLYYSGELVETHTSFVAGKEIDEMISENYQISADEARDYKHDNAFFLTNEQLEDVDEKQKVFALLMAHAFKSLVHEFKRWDVGYKINHGLNLDEIFITGGMSRTKNIAPYLTQELGIKVTILDTFAESDKKKIETIDKQKSTFNTVSCLSLSNLNRKSVINFNKAPYSIGQNTDIPIKPIGFMSVRMALLTLIILSSLVIEKFVFLKRDMKAANKQITSLVSNPVLNFNKRQQRMALTKPQSTKNTLLRKLKFIKQSISTVQSSVNYNALSPLTAFMGMDFPEGVYLESFDSVSHGEFSARIRAKEISQLKKLESTIRSMNAKNVEIKLDENEAVMNVMGVNL